MGEIKKMILDKCWSSYLGENHKVITVNVVNHIIDEAKKDFPKERLGDMTVEWAHEKWSLATREWFKKWFIGEEK